MKNHNGTWLPAGDTFFQTRGDYEARDYQHLKKYITGGRSAVDIGAHVGYWSRRLVKDYSHVFAFEAHPEHVKCLALNVFDDNCTIHTIALSDKPGTVTFSPVVANSGMSRVADSGITIPCATLDSYGLTNVDLIKIDVEGHELNVLLGAAETIQQYHPVLFMEILNAIPTSHRNKILSLLHSWGYHMVDSIDENYIFVFENDVN